jgi:hypothetical protein
LINTLSGGAAAAACNNGLLALGDTENAHDYVPRPDGVAAPEPGTFWLLGLVMTGLLYRRR